MEMSEQDIKQRLLALCELDANGLQKRLQITAETSAIVQVLIDVLISQRAALELYLAHENCGGTSCPKPMRAMCSNQMHKIVRKALAATDEALKAMGCE